MKLLQNLLLVCLFGLGLAGLAQAEVRKVALVIGNARYDSIAALRNPENDAKAVAEKLEQIGFEVTLQLDLGGSNFRRALGAFNSTSLNADIVLVFYAGHGIEMNGENFLVPIDADMSSDSTAAFEAVALNDVMRTVRNAKKLGLVLLDACRDNPYAATMQRSNGTRSISRGLAAVSLSGDSGILVSFAAEAGSTADDGDGAHSPYTTALLDNIGKPGLEIGLLFRAVRAQVKQATNGKQVPVERAQLPDENLFFVEPAAAQPEPAPAPAQPEDPTIAYARAVQSGDRASLETFLRLYPDHAKADVVRGLLLDIADDDLWLSAQTKNTENALRIYLSAFENPRHAAEANQMLEALLPPVPDSFSEYDNLDLQGNDITTAGYRPVSLQDCQAICLGDTGCKAYTYIPEKQWCWPKSAVGPAVTKANTISGLRQAGARQQSAPADLPKVFVRQADTDVSGNDMLADGLRNISIDDCETQCRATNGCVAYAYVTAKKWCWPKHSLGATSPKPGTISGW